MIADENERRVVGACLIFVPPRRAATTGLLELAALGAHVRLDVRVGHTCHIRERESDQAMEQAHRSSPGVTLSRKGAGGEEEHLPSQIGHANT